MFTLVISQLPDKEQQECVNTVPVTNTHLFAHWSYKYRIYIKMFDNLISIFRFQCYACNNYRSCVKQTEMNKTIRHQCIVTSIC